MQKTNKFCANDNEMKLVCGNGTNKSISDYKARILPHEKVNTKKLECFENFYLGLYVF